MWCTSACPMPRAMEPVTRIWEGEAGTPRSKRPLASRADSLLLLVDTLQGSECKHREWGARPTLRGPHCELGALQHRHQHQHQHQQPTHLYRFCSQPRRVLSSSPLSSPHPPARRRSGHGSTRRWGSGRSAALCCACWRVCLVPLWAPAAASVWSESVFSSEPQNTNKQNGRC